MATPVLKEMMGAQNLLWVDGELQLLVDLGSRGPRPARAVDSRGASGAVPYFSPLVLKTLQIPLVLVGEGGEGVLGLDRFGGAGGVPVVRVGLVLERRGENAAPLGRDSSGENTAALVCTLTGEYAAPLIGDLLGDSVALLVEFGGGARGRPQRKR